MHFCAIGVCLRRMWHHPQPPCLFSDLFTGRQLSWLRVCPSKGYSFSSCLHHAAACLSSLYFTFLWVCLTAIFPFASPHETTPDCLIASPLCVWPPPCFGQSLLYVIVCLLYPLCFLMCLCLWNIWVVSKHRGQVLDGNMTVMTIVVSGKIIKYGDLRCNLSDQISSVFSVWITPNSWGGRPIIGRK